MIFKEKIKPIEFIYIIVPLWAFFNLLGNYTYFQEYYIINLLKYAFGTLTIRIFCFTVIFLSYKKQSEFLKCFLIILMAELMVFFSGSSYFLVLLYIIAAGRDLKTDLLIKRLIYAYFIGVLLTVLCSSLGIISSIDVITEAGVVRKTFGFFHPNTMAIFLFYINIFFWYVYSNKLISVIFSVFTFIVSYFVCYSRTASYLVLIFGFIQILMIIVQKYRGQFTKLIWKTILISSIIASLSIFVSFIVINAKYDTSGLNYILSGRVNQINAYFNYYGLSLFGQNIGRGSEYFKYGMSTLDNSYVHMLIHFGIVFFTIYIISFIKLIVSLIKDNQKKKLITVVIYLVYGIFETVAIRFDFNATLLFLNELVWKDEKNNKKLL